jgi:hypothetical protein
VKKKKSEKKPLAWCEYMNGLIAVEWALKTEGERKVFEKWEVIYKQIKRK